MVAWDVFLGLADNEEAATIFMGHAGPCSPYVLFSTDGGAGKLVFGGTCLPNFIFTLRSRI
jgi:hypothetical protein